MEKLLSWCLNPPVGVGLVILSLLLLWSLSIMCCGTIEMVNSLKDNFDVACMVHEWNGMVEEFYGLIRQQQQPIKINGNVKSK